MAASSSTSEAACTLAPHSHVMVTRGTMATRPCSRFAA
ncbi:MAG: hypothetical protein AVDCRST_MAG85-141 [uncultured Solirubrobacteraceae bacterium]|uniref:Uncharacterized protein n=1 Tax=uncultured Solirubrobacteraceae bacterium TaxID=1162706 RepID=A0A6J4RQN6_9ACTN|nr:MAG: hypothetical protein AVDCRST_MAG85-141 [uncultured Solirubrobacteraceae bacterium]